MEQIKGTSVIYGKIEGKIVDQDAETLHIELSKDPERNVNNKRKGDYIDVSKAAFTTGEAQVEEKPKPAKKK
jgi:hypothetical protein